MELAPYNSGAYALCAWRWLRRQRWMYLERNRMLLYIRSCFAVFTMRLHSCNFAACSCFRCRISSSGFIFSFHSWCAVRVCQGIHLFVYFVECSIVCHLAIISVFRMCSWCILLFLRNFPIYFFFVCAYI